MALSKLERRGHLALPAGKSRARRRHRLRASGQPLPPVGAVPRRVEQVRGLHLHLLSGCEDPRHGLWNDLMIQQHPCGDAPLVGAQLRYLIGSEHGWLGALGFGPAAFVLGARDGGIGWSTRARLRHLPEVVGLSRLLIRQEVRCANLVSKVWSRVAARLAEDWFRRYGGRPLLVETFVDRTRFLGRSFAAAHLERVLAFDLILAWRVLALIKLGRVLPQVPASLIYTPEEREVLTHDQKKLPRGRAHPATSQSSHRQAGRLVGTPW